MSALLKILDSGLEREGYDGLFNAACECGASRAKATRVWNESIGRIQKRPARGVLP